MMKCLSIRASLGIAAFLAGGLLNAAADAGDRCNCRFFGQSYQQGTHVCMRSEGGHKVARCDLVLNNSSWIVTERRCTPGIARTTFTSPLSIARQLATAEAFKARLTPNPD